MRKAVYVVTLLMSFSFVLALSAGAGDLSITQPPNSPISESLNLPFSESLLSPNSPNVTIIYVDASATGANDGSSWADAYTELSVALEQAPYASILHIAEGTYTPGTERGDSFQLKNAVLLYGGYPAGGGGFFDERFPAAHETVLSGEIGAPGPADNSYHVITGDNTATNSVLLDGVSIAHGSATGGGDNDNGAGVFLDGSHVTFRDCMIYDNLAGGRGPALAAINGAEVTIDGCTIAGNTNTAQGSAFDFRKSELNLLNSTVGDNQSALGIGPLWLVDSESTLTNSVFVNNTNSAPSSGVITVQGGTSTINHVSMSGHNQSGLAVIEVGAAEGTATVTNSIFWDNGAVEMTIGGDSVLEVSDSVVKGGFGGGTNIITDDPQFIDAPAGDLTLAIFSPAGGTADPVTCAANDRRDYPRPIGVGCDMGAYEIPQHNSYCSTPGLAIPDNDPFGVKDSLTVGNIGLILDVDVSINATHSFVGDLSAAIRHENDGIVRTILGNPIDPGTASSCLGDDIDAKFDDEGDAPADRTCSLSPPALSGRLVPTRSLSAFNNKRLESTWTLTVRDLASDDTGTLNSWCVDVDWIPALTVTRTDDPEPDGCKPGDCSLREAILASNDSADIDDVITFAVDGPFVLSQAGAGEQFAATGDLDISDDVTIVGNNTYLTVIDGGGIDRVFDVSGGVGTELSLSDLTIQNGLLDPVDGFANGGALSVIGAGRAASLQGVILRDNHANASGTGSANGGGIFAGFGASVTVIDSAIHGNSADSNGAILNAHAAVEIGNSTIYGNTGDGGAIYNDGDASLVLQNTTIAANTATLAIITYVNDPAETASLTLVNSIISGPGAHCFANVDGAGSITIVSLGNNISGDDSCGLNEPTDLPNTDPMLGPLADNGGFTPTAAPLKGSPALDGGNDFACPANDQRGLPRLDRDGNGDGGADNNPCDIGAYELQAAFANTPPVADPQTVNVVKDTPKVITLTGSDADGDPLEFFDGILPGHGMITSALGSPILTYTPFADYTGPDSFTFYVNDGNANSDPATVTINVAATPPPNTPPVANPQTITTPMDTIKNFTLTGSDADGDPLTFEIIQITTNGNLLGQFPNIAYQPNQGFIGADSFTFRVNDGKVDSAPATVTIQVTEVTAPAFNLYLPMVRR